MRILPCASWNAALLVLFGTPLVLAQQWDLTVSKSGPDQALADTDVSYNVIITNFGPDDATAVTLNDPLPGSMTLVSFIQNSGPTFVCGGTVTCTIATLLAGASADFTFVFHIPPATAAGTTFTNIATASSPGDSNSENDSGVAVTSTPPPPQADLVLSKTAATAAGPDTDVPFTITVSNGGPDTATSVQWQDTLPGTMTFVSLIQDSGPAMICTTPAVGSGGQITCAAASFPASASAFFTLTGHVPPATASGTPFANTATVTTTTFDPSPENNSGQAIVTASAVDVAVTKIGPPTASAGTNISYTLGVANAGPDAALGVQLSDALPANTTFVSLTPDTGPASTCSTPTVGGTGSIDCTFSSLANGDSAQFTLVIAVGNTTALTNTATVSADSFDTNAGNDTASAPTAVTPIADLATTKSGPLNVVAGSSLTYAVTVTNNGISDASTVSVSDTLPADTTLVAATQTSGPSFLCTTPAVGDTGTITCTIATLAAGASATFNFTLDVSVTAPGPILNTATVAAVTTDPVPGNGTSSATTTVSPAPVVAIPTLSSFALALCAAVLALLALRGLRS